MRIKFNLKEAVITIGIFLTAIAISELFCIWGFSESNIIMVFILGVVLTAINTNGYIYCVSFSLISVFAFNYFFIEPRFGFAAYHNQYPLTFIIMFIIAFLAGTSTARLKKQMELSEKNAMIAQKERIRSNILRSVSHDLRTPLTSISGCVDSILSNKNIDEESKHQMLLDIQSDTDWLIRLIENLLNISKIEEGLLQVDKSPEVIEEIITEAVCRTAVIMGNRTLEIKIPDEIFLVPMNGELIIQVIINLIENSIKHSPDGSAITITVTKNINSAVIVVSDEGEGINENDLPHIFEKFYTTGKSGDSRRGTGLGLAICKAVVNAHGGEIKASNNEMGGADVCFILPFEGKIKNE